MTDTSQNQWDDLSGYSYVTLAQANAIANGQLFPGTWFSADPDQRSRALITATSLLDRLRWQGRPLAPTQPLAWPRIPDHCPAGYPLTVAIPTAIIQATVEFAIYLIDQWQVPGGPAIMQQMIGETMTSYAPHVADELPRPVRRLLEPFLRVASANCAEVVL